MAFDHTNPAVAALAQEVAGNVITREDEAYEKTRRGWNLTIDHHPALIVVPANAQDVVAAVNFARAQHLAVGVQNSGHGVQYPADDSLLISIGGLNDVAIDAERRTARVGGGARWEHVLDKATPLGLAPLLGTSPHVGVVGYTLGGGLGWLGRLYGLAADSVRAIEVVTADGTLRHVSASENGDLFWAMRGSGGNFGVVTALEFSLYPVAKVYGGILTYPGELAGEALRFYRDWVKTVPDALTSSPVLINYPDFPQLPEALRGKKLLLIRAAFVGAAEQGAALIDPWLRWREPIKNSFAEIPFAQIGVIGNDPVDPAPTYAANEQLDELSDEAIDVIVRHMADRVSGLMFTEIRHAGGAIARADADSAALSNRDAQFYLTMAGFGPTAPAREALAATFKSYQRDLRPYTRGTVYLNFASGSMARDRVKDTFPAATYDRLLALKRQYDPDTMFRFSYQLVQPTLAAQVS